MKNQTSQYGGYLIFTVLGLHEPAPPSRAFRIFLSGTEKCSPWWEGPGAPTTRKISQHKALWSLPSSHRKKMHGRKQEIRLFPLLFDKAKKSICPHSRKYCVLIWQGLFPSQIKESAHSAYFLFEGWNASVKIFFSFVISKIMIRTDTRTACFS